MVVIQCLQVLGKEQERVTISTMKWLPQVSSILVEDQDVPLFMDKWMNPPVQEQELDWQDSQSQSTSETRKEKMCCFSLTISLDSHKHVQRCLPFWVVFHLPSVINPHWQQIWDNYKKELQQQRRDPSHQCRLFMYLQTILQIQHQPQHLLTWMLPLCCQEHSLN